MPLIEKIAAHLVRLRGEPVLRVGIDGVDGVGKTVFADALAVALAAHGQRIIRASVDGFHHPRSIRYRRGRKSPEGFYRDSYDYPALKAQLLDPLSRGGSGRYRTAIFDHRSDSPVETAELEAADGAILVFDGLFLHRPELRGYWDFSIFLDAPFAVTVPRGAAREAGFDDPDPAASANRRYVEGNMIYFREARPHDHATIVVDYTDLSRPRVIN